MNCNLHCSMSFFSIIPVYFKNEGRFNKSFASAHATCRCTVLFISSLFRLSGALRSIGVSHPAVPCFSLCPCPACSCQRRRKMGERKRRLCLPGKYIPSGRSNFRFTRPGTLAVSFHVADNAVLAHSNHYVRNAAGEWNLGRGWG